MKFLFKILVFVFLSTPVDSSSFSEVFGSEGAAGINNPKQRFLSFTLQYLTLSGSIGYVGKQLFNSGFMSPLGFTPDSMRDISPIAYKNDFLSEPNYKLMFNKEKVSKLNQFNDYQKEAINLQFSSRSIESRTRSNLINSLNRLEQRNLLSQRYLNAK